MDVQSWVVGRTVHVLYMFATDNVDVRWMYTMSDMDVRCTYIECAFWVVPLSCFGISTINPICVLNFNWLISFRFLIFLLVLLIIYHFFISILYEICNRHSKHLIQQWSGDIPNAKVVLSRDRLQTRSNLFIFFGVALHI